jgi:rubrerythrin
MAGGFVGAKRRCGVGRRKQDVARAAVQLEKDGRVFYMESAAKASSALARGMFESLAQDELNHIGWIEKLSPGAADAGSANRALYERLRPIFAAAPAGLRLAVEFSKSDLDAIEIAIGMEEKSIEAYQDWAETADSDDVRLLCRTLAGQERFHRQLLENTKTYLDQSADWFMKEKQWNFEGA